MTTSLRSFSLGLVAAMFSWAMDASAQHPAFQWAGTFTAPTGSSGTAAPVLDGHGNIYVTGGFTGTVDFDPGPGTANLTSQGLADIYVCKLDAAGQLVWAKGMGGPGFDACLGIAVDGSGNVYTTGYFDGTADFDPGPGTSHVTSNGNTDIFVSKLDAGGNYVWAKNIGGPHNEHSADIAVDGHGNIYFTGVYMNTVDFDPGSGMANLSSSGLEDIFVCKLDGGGNYIWAKGMGGSLYDGSTAITVDGTGNVYTTGAFKGTADFDPGTGTAGLTGNGSYEVFVSKLDANGAYVWARSMGGPGHDGGDGIAVDGNGQVFTTGIFQDTADFDPGTGTSGLTSNGNTDIFISKLDAAGNHVWARSIGGPGNDHGRGITVDGNSHVYTTGEFHFTADFDPGPGTASLTSKGQVDIFVCKLDAAGNSLWARSMGSSGGDAGFGIAADANGHVYTSGTFSDTADFDPGPGTANRSSGRGSAGFLIKWSQLNLRTHGPEGSGSRTVAVFPNPTTGIARIELPDIRDEAAIFITDLAGRTIASKNAAKRAGPTVMFDLGDMAKGMYFVTVREGDFTYPSARLILK